MKELSVPGIKYEGNKNEAGALFQAITLTKRMFVNNTRNIGLFWLRMGM